MSDPTGYTVSYSFSGFQANAPTTPLPAPQVDAEFANVATSTATLAAAITDIRRSDGALKNGIVTFDSFELGLQLTIDPTNGQLVAAAVATAQAAATSASGSNASAAAHDTAAATSATAASASAASTNFTLYLPKAGNLVGIGNANAARSNIQAANIDGSDMIGRLASVCDDSVVTNWNAVITNGWGASAPGAAHAPDTTNYWVVQTIAADVSWMTQIAFPFAQAASGVSFVTPMRRHSYLSAGVTVWQPWEGFSPVPVGSTIWVNATTAPPGFLKENGALVARATYPALYAFAAASGNMDTEAGWSGGNFGGFSSGDLSTTFRLPDSRGEFTRSWDDGRGVDSGRVISAHQADALKDHTHSVAAATTGTNQAVNAAGAVLTSQPATITSSGASTGAATETRPRNNAKLACIKY